MKENTVYSVLAFAVLWGCTLVSGLEVTMIGAAWIDRSNMGCYWFNTGQVSCGAVDDLDSNRTLYAYSLSVGYTPNDVVGMAWSEDDGMVCVFHDDSNVSCGSTSDLDSSRSLRPYTLPQNRTANEIVAVAWLDRNLEYICAWYTDGISSCGRDWVSYIQLDNDTIGSILTLPSNYSVDDIVDIAYLDNSSRACAWYRDGYVSCGNSTLDLSNVQSPFQYNEPDFNLSCSSVESAGNIWSPDIVEALDAEIGGTTYTINKFSFKSFRLESIDSLSFNGCQGTIKVSVKLDRPWPFVDASGDIILTADVDLTQTEIERFCLINVQVTEVNLDRTSLDNVIKDEANDRLDDEFCVEVPDDTFGFRRRLATNKPKSSNYRQIRTNLGGDGEDNQIMKVFEGRTTVYHLRGHGRGYDE